MSEEESIFHCDWQGSCKRLPFVEIYPFEVDEDNNLIMEETEYGTYPKFQHRWCYLCIWHFFRALVRGDKFAWVRVSIKDIIRKGEYDDD